MRSLGDRKVSSRWAITGELAEPRPDLTEFSWAVAGQAPGSVVMWLQARSDRRGRCRLADPPMLRITINRLARQSAGYA